MALQRKSRASAAERAQKRGSVAATLAARRLELDLSQGEVADLAGVARSSVIAAESGRAVSLDALLAIVQVLGLHLEIGRGPRPAEVQISAELRQRYGLDGAEAIAP